MPDLKDITIAICAFNAEATIKRAVTSAVQATDGPILLVDDHSIDQTAVIAQNIAGRQLTIVRPAEKLGIGNARSAALDAIRTPYGMWLDADDEISPDRPARFCQAFEQTGADLIFDAADLIDGASNDKTAQLEMPTFLEGSGIWRLFERNWLPGLWGGFRSDFARATGYDRTFYNSEDYDFTLRALMAGGRFHMIKTCGYRYYHYPASVSRNLDQATNFTSAAIAKHSLKAIKGQMKGSGMSEAEQTFLRCTVAVSAGKYQDAVQIAEAARPETQVMVQVIAPYGASAATLLAFLAGSALLKLGQPQEALKQLNTSPLKTAAHSNNIGVCHQLLGDVDQAQHYFNQALRILPGYVDAAANLKAAVTPTTPRITLLPMRPTLSRSSYSE